MCLNDKKWRTAESTLASSYRLSNGSFLAFPVYRNRDWRLIFGRGETFALQA
jgi:hypothetical protein